MSNPEKKEVGSGAVRSALEGAERARKEAARASLRRQINQVQGLINEANAIKADLNTANTNIGTSVSSWSQGLSTFESGAMSAIVVTDKFEGVAAAALQSQLPEPIAHMDAGIAEASGTQTAIAAQITKLNTYISTKGALLSSLYGQLQAL